MKKTYLSPSVLIECQPMEQLLSSSPGVISDNGIGFGGIDQDGTLDPSSRRHSNMWNDDEDDDEF